MTSSKLNQPSFTFQTNYSFVQKQTTHNFVPTNNAKTFKLVNIRNNNQLRKNEQKWTILTNNRNKFSTEVNKNSEIESQKVEPTLNTEDKALNQPIQLTIEREKIPRTALILGGLGLAPLAIGSASIYFLGPASAGLIVFYQLNYGTCLLSFLGAVHWGLAMSKYTSITSNEALNAMYPELTKEKKEELLNQKLETTSKLNSIRYCLSILPFTYAWCLTGLSPTYALTGVIFGFGAQYVADVWADKKGLVPSWYLKLRTPLTIGVIMALGSTLMLLN